MSDNSSISIVSTTLASVYRGVAAGGASGQSPAKAGTQAQIASSVPLQGNDPVGVSVKDSSTSGDMAKQAVAPGQNAEQASNGQVWVSGQPQIQAGFGSDKEETAPTDDPLAQDRDVLERVQESINEYLKSSNRSLEFSFDEASGRTVIKVMDEESDEVIRQIPPETALELMARIRDGDSKAATGLLIDNISA